MLYHRLAALAVLAVASAPALAANCAAEIEGNDAMKFNKTEIEVSQSCKEFKLTLKHSGKMTKQVMGHNWVLSKTADMQPIANEGIAAGAAKDYIKADDARILAHTKLLGGGESDTVTFSPAKLAADGSYSYFCTFPGHAALMKGTIKLVK